MKLPASITAAIASFLNDLCTTRDGVSFDVIRVGMILSGGALIFFQGWDVIANKAAFNAMSFGPGVASIFAGGGLGIAAKRNDEPDA